MVYTTKFYLLYQETEEMNYQQFCKAMFDIDREVRTFKNLASSECWHDIVQHMQWKDLHGAYPKTAELKDLGIRPIRNRLYQMATNMIPTLQTANASSIAEDVNHYFTSHKKELMAGKQRIPSYLASQPIDLCKRSIGIEQRGEDHYCKLSLFSKIGTQAYGLKPNQELGTSAGQCLFKVWHKSESSKPILDRCISGEYEVCASQLAYDQDKRMWELIFSYKFQPQEKGLDPNNVLGIDLGVKCSLAMAMHDSEKRWFFRGSDVEEFRKRTEARRRAIRKERPRCGEGAIGHGRKTRTLPAERIQDSIDNFRDTKNHNWSREVIKIATKNNCGTIQMENLTGISEGKQPKYLKDWTYFDLQTKIQYKAEEAGIKVILIDPQYTSQRCSKCGHIAEENRETRDRFVCKECGYTADADYNAARNIATPDIESLISTQRANQQREP